MAKIEIFWAQKNWSSSHLKRQDINLTNKTSNKTLLTIHQS
jgi:hypothetical protein